MIGTARTLDADAASAYLNGLISYEQSGRLVHPTTERIAALVAALGAGARRARRAHLRRVGSASARRAAGPPAPENTGREHPGRQEKARGRPGPFTGPVP
jgi:hypothetical protein